MRGNIELLWNVRGQKCVGRNRGHIGLLPEALLKRRLGPGNTNFVPGRSGRIEGVVDLRVLLPAGLDGCCNSAFVDEDGGVVSADIRGFVLDIAVGVRRRFVFNAHDPDRSGAGAILAHRGALDL